MYEHSCVAGTDLINFIDTFQEEHWKIDQFLPKEEEEEIDESVSEKISMG